ncbi:quercetin dioxygenase-like cupin family protein [Deinobacterium chartae]|uniref:Quercetin dioxygenase-like cupin family protein n=1 Tax=Deinobacterium chartae TaxID=521158 RepID=A0A841I502_9DEIO|nr:cupin domain-containing protein [Deinobacterium chartae]MBB6100114.1 quercetin dioxygenase-like cupin family protein [Deinobacterium chartae]
MRVDRLFDSVHLEPGPGFRVRPFSGEHSTALHFHLEAGAVAAEHAHPHEQLTVILRGELEYVLEGETRVLRAGDAVFVPGNARHGGRALSEVEALEFFTPVREDLMQKLAVAEAVSSSAESSLH